MIQQGQRVADNPVYLADLAASLTSASPSELQQILEEKDVSWLLCDLICYIFVINTTVVYIIIMVYL